MPVSSVSLNSLASMLINDDIEAIIQHGEERTTELNTKYEGLTSKTSVTSNLIVPCNNGRAKTSELMPVDARLST